MLINDELIIIEDKIKNLEIRKKDILSIVFIGHVDAGKSTIGGQILNKLGLIDKCTLEKYRQQAKEQNRESWYFSWALDTDECERAKGKTAEVGRAYFELTTKKVILLDAPGHSMYVSDMISGANQADVAVLVVSARKNEFEAGFEKNGQTREHVFLSRAGGIKKLIILVNKMDDVDWSYERFEYIRKKLNLFIDKIYPQKEVYYIPISGFMGYNILEKFDGCSWYNEETFLNYLEKVKIQRDNDSKFTFTILDKNRQLGFLIYDGKVESGKLTRSDVILLPKQIETSIIGIYDEEEIEINEALSGDFVKIKLKENYEQIEEGDTLMEKGCNSFIVSNEFTCSLTILEAHNIISIGYQCVLHLRVNKVECKVIDLGTTKNNKIKKIKFARKGEKVLARIRVNSPIVLTNTSEKGKQADMFALRNENLTIGIGIVKKVMSANLQ